MIYTSTTGLIHLIASLLALFFGTWVITTKKGTPIHRKAGYAYAINMIVLIVTSFMMYRLFGGWGIFHWFALISTISLLGGLVPAILRKPEKTWFSLHFNFMYWSVMGLYAALVAEIFTRIPQMRFFSMVFGATFLVMGLANVFYFRYKKRWAAMEGVMDN